MTERSRTTEVVLASANGRVNLMGDHTDYNDGFVLPMLIPQSTRVRLQLREDRQVTAVSTAMASPDSYVLGEERPRGSWIDYVQGVTHVLRGHGCSLHGFDLRIDSNVPAGAGLSSSAALEIALLRALRHAFGLEIDQLHLARLGRSVETDFIGVPIGIMDQMVASVGRQGEALFIDTRSLETRRVPIPRELEVVVIDSGIAHDNAQSGYRKRREECDSAAAALGLQSLRDFQPAEEPLGPELAEALRRRVRHVLSENARVLQLITAFERSDLTGVRAAFTQSHASLRDDYQVSTPEIDCLVQLAEQCASVVGARMTGGGFGGSVVLLAHAGQARLAAEYVARAYAEASGKVPRILLPMETI
jgi:galactokinase